MTSTNPYQPPQAVVADVAVSQTDTFQEVKVWSWRDRLGRLRFLAYGAVAFLVYFVLDLTIGLAVSVSGLGARSPGSIYATSWVLLILYLVFFAMIAVRRSHDMGWSGWTSLLAFIPLVGLIWVFKAGSPSTNHYGRPPSPNTLGVKIAAFGVFGLVVLFGILAAIALPAYQQYVKRAVQTAPQK